MKLRRNKKGFTIVELVIVIAVIGVLAAILIPTFVNLTNKANRASDESLVKNLNTALAMKEQDPEKDGGGKNATMYDAVEDLKEYGYLLPNLVTKAEDKLLWNQETNRFILEDGDKQGYADINFWRIQNSIEENQKYSVFAGVDFQPSENGSVTVAVGFDAGYKENITKVNYTRVANNDEDKQTVTIRTNNGDLVVNAPKDTVHHYSFLDKLDVQAIHTESYHEHGKVRVSMTVNSGHVVIEENGSVNELNVPEGANATVNVQPQGQVDTIIMDSDSATINAEQGSTINQIVGETENISGAGAAEAKETAITKTLVYNEAGEDKLTLRQALEAQKEYIVLAEDLSLAAWDKDNNVAVNLTYDVILDGNGHSITTTATRGIWVDSSNVDVTIRNLKITGTSLQRAFQINGYMTGVNMLLDHVEATVSYYTVNVCSNTTDIGLTIVDSKLNGWGALNVWGSTYDVYVSNSTLVGHNDKSYNKDGWNDFGTVILEGDTTAKTDEHASDINVKLFNCDVTASTSGQGNKQWCVLFNNPSTHNNVIAEGCTFNYKHSENTYLLLGANETNHFFNNGTEVFDD